MKNRIEISDFLISLLVSSFLASAFVLLMLFIPFPFDQDNHREAPFIIFTLLLIAFQNGLQHLITYLLYEFHLRKKEVDIRKQFAAIFRTILICSIPCALFSCWILYVISQPFIPWQMFPAFSFAAGFQLILLIKPFKKINPIESTWQAF